MHPGLSEKKLALRTAAQLGALVPDSHILGESYAAVRKRGGVQAVLREYNLPPHISHSWRTGYGHHTLPDGRPNPDDLSPEGYKILSVARLIGLEERHKGAASVLYSRNRIHNFGRSSVDMLSHLYTDRLKKAGRLFLLATARFCDNGARIGTHEIYESLQADMPTDTAFEHIELGYPSDVCLIPSLVRSHGAHAKLHVVTLAMHASSQFGFLHQITNRKERILFSKEDVGLLGDALSAVSLPETTILMNACSSGEGKDSLAERISRMTGLKTYAPTMDVGVEDITLKDRRGILVPAINFTEIYPNKANTKWLTRPTSARRFNARRHIWLQNAHQQRTLQRTTPR